MAIITTQKKKKKAIWFWQNILGKGYEKKSLYENPLTMYLIMTITILILTLKNGTEVSPVNNEGQENGKISNQSFEPRHQTKQK